MNTFLDFLSDNTFFAIFSGVIIVLVLAFIVTLVKGKKDFQKPIEDVSEDNYTNEQVTNENISNISNTGYPVNEFETNMMGSNSPDTGYQAAFTNYVPDLNESESSNTEIPSLMQDNAVEEVPYQEPIFPDVQELTETPAVEMPIIPEVKEMPEAVSNIIMPSINEEKEVVDNIFPDFVSKEDTVSVEPIEVSSNDDDIELPLPITETPELAFAAMPSEDTSINEEIKFETTDDYDIEKTEIFDFPDFSKTEIDSEKALVDIEKVVLEAANKYIESVMKS